MIPKPRLAPLVAESSCFNKGEDSVAGDFRASAGQVDFEGADGRQAFRKGFGVGHGMVVLPAAVLKYFYLEVPLRIWVMGVLCDQAGSAVFANGVGFKAVGRGFGQIIYGSTGNW